MPANARVDYPLVTAAISTVADWVNRYRQIERSSGLGECDAKEMARIASDLGVTADDLRRLSKTKRGSATLLRHMLTAIGIDAKALTKSDPMVMRDLERICTGCADKKRCRHELEDFSAAGHYHEFCPNAVTLDALVAERSRQSGHAI